jgi:hypothetical protein
MSGSRKYRLALLSLAALCVGYGVAVWRGTAADLYGEFAFGLFLIVAGFGGANGIEHLAGAVRARRGGGEPRP